MASFGKIIGGGLGWTLGGPIGGIIGVALGHYFDQELDKEADKERQARQGNRTQNTNRTRNNDDHRYGTYQKYQQAKTAQTAGGDFAMSLMVLTAAVMKADGKVLKSELDYVKNFLGKQFSEQDTLNMLQVLKDALNQAIPVRQVCLQISYNMDHAQRLQMMHYLFGLANSDGGIDTAELNVLHQIASYLRVSAKDFESIKAMFIKTASTTSAYSILEVSRDASNEDIKKAYRRMAIKYHPDKVAALGEEFQKAATEKFQKVQEAFEAIKKERGFN